MTKSFASRAGYKLEHALEFFNIDVRNLICADLGCSTGGFTDCLLQRGAAKVYSVDTAYGELAWTLRNDPKVVVTERTNALHVELPETVDLVTIDVGWTPQSLILPKALSLLNQSSGQIVSLIKPHYEANKKDLEKGRLPEDKIPETLDLVKSKINEIEGVKLIGIEESPIEGKRGQNKEYLAYLIKE